MKPTRVEVRCQDKYCPWQDQEFMTLSRATNVAKVHREHTGHMVKIDVVYYIAGDDDNE